MVWLVTDRLAGRQAGRPRYGRYGRRRESRRRLA